jgi:hypothetical protein
MSTHDVGFWKPKIDSRGRDYRIVSKVLVLPKWKKEVVDIINTNILIRSLDGR